MPMGDEDAIEAPEADARTQDLSLRPLAAVDQEPVVAETHHLGRKAAMNGRGGGGWPEKNDVKKGAPQERVPCGRGPGDSLYLNRRGGCRYPMLAGAARPLDWKALRKRGA